MLDTAIGSITGIIDNVTFIINVTHIGTHNKFRYNSYETVTVATNKTDFTLSQLRGIRVRCLVKYRDTYNRLYADIELV